MSTSTKYYPAKLLLFGEYTVLHGGQALAMPFDRYVGYWRFLKEGEQAQNSLQPFFQYLQTVFSKDSLDFNAFAGDISEGLIFDSTIPWGYGAGSSGSLCAGIWDKYGREQGDIEKLRTIFAQMESFFHGKSSGIDPLVSYLNRPVLQSGNSIEVLDAMSLPKEISVFDSGISRRTAPLVDWYHREYAENPGFKQQVLDKLLPQNTKAIEAIRAKDRSTLKTAFQEISRWQKEFFAYFIPESVRGAWEQAEKEGDFFKICGAGGGGFFLVWSD